MRGLRENLIQHYNFEALYPSIWTHLYSWYSADIQITRFLKLDTMSQDEANLLNSLTSQNLKLALHGQDSISGGPKYALDLYPQKFADKMFRHQRLDFPTPAENNPDRQRNQENTSLYTK